MRFWKLEYNSRPRHLFDDGHDVSLRVEREKASFDVLERNAPLSPWNAPRNRSQGEEFYRIPPEDPICAAHGNGLPDTGHIENIVPLFCRIQDSPPPAVRFESRAAGN